MAEAGICICSSVPVVYVHRRSSEVRSRYSRHFRSRIGGIRAGQLQIALIGSQNFGYRVGGTGRGTRTVLKCGTSNGVENRSPVVKSSGDDNDDDGKIENSGFSIGGDGDVVDAASSSKESEGEAEPAHIPHLRELLKLSQLDLERARVNSTKIETEAQRFAERAIALRDQAAAAASAADAAKSLLEDQAGREMSVKEALEDAKLLLDAARARLESAGKAVPEGSAGVFDVSEEVESAQREIQRCEDALKGCERELSSIQSAKLDLEKESARLSELADAAKNVAAAADEDVATAMVLAEKAVALELEAAERLSDAEIAVQKAETQLREASVAVELRDGVITPVLPADKDEISLLSSAGEKAFGSSMAEAVVGEEKDEARELAVEKAKEILEKIKTEAEPTEMAKVQASGSTRKDNAKEVVEPGMLKYFRKKSSRFFPASFFSSGETEEFSPSSLFSGLVSSLKNNFPKALAGAVLLLGGGFYVAGRMDKLMPLSSYNIEDVTTNTKPIIKNIYRMRSRVKTLLEKVSHQEVNEEEASLRDVLWLLLASVVFVPLFQKIPGGSPVLGYLAAGVLIGPHSLHIIQNVHATKAIAELGVVFLLFNIGLELSVERLSSMRKYVFGFGSSQVLITALVTGLSVHYLWGIPGPAAIVIGNGLALSSTAVVLQVLQERGESTSRHGRATFSVLLFQDLAVVVLLILIPLLSPNSSKGGVGFKAIAEALGIAAIKGVIAISGIIAGGRLLLRPIYRSMAENHNAEIFAANTLLVVLGTSVLTARAGLSMALGAFLAGLLLSETEFALQVESDIAPYRGLLLGLFFMTVGMSIDPNLFVARFPVIMGSLALLILGKGLLIAVLGRQYGLSNVAAVRAGLLLAPGGEFAFVAFGEAVNQRIMSPQLSSLLFLVVGLSMAVTPWLAAAGQLIATRFEQQDVRSLLPAETETDDLRGHMIVCGFGRVGQIISQMLSERLIPFVALDVRSERVSMGRSLDLPVYFGDAGSKEVLHKLGAERAAAAVITLDTPGANYRAVWALSKHFPNVKTYVRAHDVDHGINLEKAGATAVVPETLEPSLQLAAAILAEAKLPASEIAATINEFRSRHLSELTELTEASGTSLGYGFSQTTSSTPKPKQEADDERRFGGVVAVP